MGQFGSMLSSNPQMMQMAGQMGGGMMGGKGGGKGKDDGIGPDKTSNSMQDMGEKMDPLGQSFSAFADTEFAESDEYRKQRAQGMPEVNEPQLQNVQSAASKLGGLFGGKPAEQEVDAPEIDTKPAEVVEDSSLDLNMPELQKDEDGEESRLAKINALKGMFA